MCGMLGLAGTESLCYWLIGGFTGWERAHWRLIPECTGYSPAEYVTRDMATDACMPELEGSISRHEEFEWSAYPDKIRPFELPPIFPMVFWWKVPIIKITELPIKKIVWWDNYYHEFEWRSIKPTRRNVLLCSAAALVICVILEVIL